MKRWVRSLCIGIISLFALSCMPACTDLFFVPSRIVETSPDKLGLAYRELKIPVEDGTYVVAWELPAEGVGRGYVTFFHGNAQNMGNHIYSVSWLPKLGYHVLLIDYRGYGSSPGHATVENAIADCRSALLYGFDRSIELKVPFFMFGQSLGGALGIVAAADIAEQLTFSGIVIDSSFASYRRIVREKLGELWLTAWLKYPLSLLINDSRAPERYLAKHSQIPMLFLHAEQDPVVPLSCGLELYKAAGDKRELITSPQPSHIALLNDPLIRQRFLEFLRQNALPTPG